MSAESYRQDNDAKKANRLCQQRFYEMLIAENTAAERGQGCTCFESCVWLRGSWPFRD